jgi:hypothetical protein
MTAPQKLLRFDEVAKILDVPVEGLRKVADQHGVTLIIGRAARLHPDDIGSLLEKCRVGQKGRVSTGENQAAAESRSGKSGTAQHGSRPAQIAAKMLKKSSRHTSSESTAQPVQLHPKK